MKWTSIPFFRFSLAFTAGILFYIHSSTQLNYFLFFLLSIILFLIFYFISFNKKLFHRLKPFLGISALSSLFFFGGLYSESRDEKNKKDHLIYQNEKILYYEGTVIENSEEREKTFRTKVEIEKIKTQHGWKSIIGKIILYTSKENFRPLKYGDKIMVKGSPELVKAPSNPFEFDYQNYLRFQQIHHSDFVKAKEINKINHQVPSEFIAASLSIREQADDILRRFIHKDNEYKIASALILGIRSTLDNDLKVAYSSTGTMHVLAVSGLHVAIILGILLILLKFLKLSSTGKIILPILLVFLLWTYAFITGFSASVLRAVVMFSLAILAQSLNRNTNNYNTLFLSAFILLCIDPFFIMDAGFQLSFLAVLGIMYFNPKIYSLFTFKNYFLDKGWALISVSIAAQIATFPLTVYYFHQFPLNFILSNLVAIPISFIILYSGMALLLLCWIPVLNNILGWITEKGIWFMNELIFGIEDIPYSNLTRLDIDLPEMICIFLLMIFIATFLLYKKINLLIISTFILLIFSIMQIMETISQKNQKKIIVYSIPGHRAIAIINGTHAEILADSSLIRKKEKQQFHMEPYLIQYGISEVNYQNIEEKNFKNYHSDSLTLFYFDNKSFLIQHQSNKSIPENFKVDYFIHSEKKKDAKAVEIIL